ncbi:unnamed protein product [Brassica oleracea]|uniref:(rape) hypothetical protein n=1 Tax=Brassica napus TaxID=3708 RepID=A0A816QLN9_BRANA|nr:unnamed protein product [Brassica napus]
MEEKFKGIGLLENDKSAVSCLGKMADPSADVAAASPRRSIATTTARPVGFHRVANPASSSSVIHRCFSSKSVETIAKKEVEDVMPIATGHEKEELEAELELSLIGDSGVGKSCLLLRWSQGHKKKQSM